MPTQRAAAETSAAWGAPSAQLLRDAGESACGRLWSLRRVPGLDAGTRGEWDSLPHWFFSLYHSETGGVELDRGEKVCFTHRPFPFLITVVMGAQF